MRKRETKKTFLNFTAFVFVLLCAVFFTTCGSGAGSNKSEQIVQSAPSELADLQVRGPYVSDETIENIYNNLSKNISARQKVALIPVYSGSGMDELTAASVTEMLEAQFLNDQKYEVFTREFINKAIDEQKFQAVNVSNETAVQFGKLVGAHVIVIGNVDGRGAAQRIIMRALEVNTGRILAMFMELLERERGFSEIYIQAAGETGSTVWLGSEYNIQTDTVKIEANSEGVFKVPNGRWDIHFGNNTSVSAAPSYTTEFKEDTRLYYSERNRTPNVRHEPIAGAARGTAARVVFAREAAAKMAAELRGKIPARAGLALFPLTNRGISADDGDLLFDAMNIELAGAGGLNIIEKQKLLALLDEYDFQMSGAVGARTIGQLLGADVVIFGIGEPKTIELVAVDVARFTILSQVTHSY